MLDRAARRLIDPPLDRFGRRLAARGISADQITLAGLVLGLAAAGLVWLGQPLLALLPLLAGRVADGLDGAVARAGRSSDYGGLIDITADFAFYGAVPLAFVLADPGANASAGAFLLFAFYVNGASFLGLAALAARRGLETRAQGIKSIYYSNGLLEGTETILFFVAFCLWPAAFAALAWLFGALCLLTAALRLAGARRLLSEPLENRRPID